MKKIIIIITVLLLMSCERENDILGPSLNDIYGEFNIIEKLDISNRNVDFENSQIVYFTAEFSKTVDWQIKIKGNISGAEKIINGYSRIINENNSLWDGSTTNLPFFKIEDCNVELYIPSDSLFFYDNNLTILSTKVFDGLIVADFENGLNPNWIPFVQAGTNMSFNIINDNAPEGNSYYDMGGDVDWDWLIGMIDFPASAYGQNTFNLNDNPDQVYFNLLLYLPENLINPPLVLFQFKEDDNLDNEFTPGIEDMYSIELREFKLGWQIISIKYSDLLTLSNGATVEPDGDGIMNPDKLNMISMLFLAQQGAGYSQVYVDYLIFTESQPL
tara:strand:- start:10003 stop:10992 length:990 start_codon:yes stop_codon:yes gene_type:complete